MKRSSFKGTNLGGWLVLEKWMTPSLFENTRAINEYELVQTASGETRLRTHHETFMTESDFQWLHDHGIGMVRIPVGYWIFGDEEPYIGAIDRLDWVITMAEKYKLKVLIDLHGAPGAQNAAEHSGSGRPGLPLWLEDKTKQERTIQALERLAKRYYSSSAVWGIELVNEPLADRFGLKLIRFYRHAYKRLLKVARPGLTIVFSDGFKPLLLTGALRGRKRLPIVMDCHLYQCFDEKDFTLTLRQHLKKAARRRWLIRLLQVWQPVIIGEWSGILPWALLKELSAQERQEATRQFIDQQRRAYSGSLGWFYWNYKTEKASGWNLRSLVENDPTMLQ